MKDAYLGIDIGSISTKGVIIDDDHHIISSKYIWTEGDPIGASKRLLQMLEEQFDKENYRIVASGTTGSARKLVGDMINATVVKNEITAHAIGTTTIHPDVRTIFEIGGQDSKIILIENGIAVDYAMNTLCAAGTGSFLSSQSKRLGVEVEEFGQIALKSQHPTQIAARCTVFAESDLVHKIQMGHTKEDIIAGLCHAVANNYLNNVGKGKKIGVSFIYRLLPAVDLIPKCQYLTDPFFYISRIAELLPEIFPVHRPPRAEERMFLLSIVIQRLQGQLRVGDPAVIG